ncbi:MAG TPA: hypothetical protein VMV20_07160 [Chitinophagaceae bacterium]|nr:hypothetical protein [Chitinophagaceae bacterium]
MKASVLGAHFLAMALVSIFFLLLYTTVQQTYRMQANDPQIQVAGDIAHRIGTGSPLPPGLVPDSIDLDQESGLFLEIYDGGYQPVSSTATLDGRIPVIPPGVLLNTRNRGEEQISWEPRRGVRLATDVRFTGNSRTPFVVVGRSLRDTEDRIANLGWMVLLGWLFSLSLIVIHYPVSGFLRSRFP